MAGRRPLVATVAVVSLLSLACEPGDPVSEASGPTMALEPCRLEGVSRQARCGTFEVFEDRQAGSGRTLGLRVAVVPAWGRNPEPDPVFLLAGGPGQAATEAFAPMISALDDIARDRDLVMVDQRGTGSSAPLDCKPAESLAQQLEDNLDVDEIHACRAEQDADLTQYTTPIAMDDLDDVRAALGYDAINLVGGSYGTRAALVYLRRHPGHVRTITIDGVAPPALTLPLGFARDAQRAFDHLVESCQAETACNTAFPDPAADLDQLLGQLERAPAQVTVAHPRTGEPTALSISRHTFAGGLRGLLYSADLSALVPLVLSRALAGDYSPFVAAVTAFSDSVRDMMSVGMFLSVVCAEDLPSITDEAVARETKDTFLGDHVVAIMRGACEHWGPPATLPPGYADSIESDTPALVLSGTLDPVTPPRWGESVAASLSRSRHIVVPGVGHGTLSNRCVAGVVASFVESGTADGLDASCVDAVVRPPFFIDHAGPSN